MQSVYNDVGVIHAVTQAPEHKVPALRRYGSARKPKPRDASVPGVPYLADTDLPAPPTGTLAAAGSSENVLSSSSPRGAGEVSISSSNAEPLFAVGGEALVARGSSSSMLASGSGSASSIREGSVRVLPDRSRNERSNVIGDRRAMKRSTAIQLRSLQRGKQHQSSSARHTLQKRTLSPALAVDPDQLGGLQPGPESTQEDRVGQVVAGASRKQQRLAVTGSAGKSGSPMPSYSQSDESADALTAPGPHQLRGQMRPSHSPSGGYRATSSVAASQNALVVPSATVAARMRLVQPPEWQAAYAARSLLGRNGATSTARMEGMGQLQEHESSARAGASSTRAGAAAIRVSRWKNAQEGL